MLKHNISYNYLVPLLQVKDYVLATQYQQHSNYYGAGIIVCYIQYKFWLLL